MHSGSLYLLLSKTDFHSAVQLTDTKAFVVGDKGMLLTTNDRRSTLAYDLRILHIGTNFNSIKFVDGDTYYNSYIVGDLGVILRQIVGGEAGKLFLLPQTTTTMMYLL